MKLVQLSYAKELDLDQLISSFSNNSVYLY